MKINRKLSLFLVFPVMSGCSSALLFKSEPVAATVSVQIGSSSKKEIGKTPFEMSYSEFEKLAPGSAASGEMIPLVFEKESYAPQTMLVPSVRMGVSTATVTAVLKPMGEDDYSADKLLQMIHNAQKFANAGDYTRALEEANKAIEKNPKFVRAMSLKGAIYFAQSRWDDSLIWYEKALEVDSGFDEAIKMISEIKQKKSGQ
jgi:tetratricopeptide (TPR) repeat protein